MSRKGASTNTSISTSEGGGEMNSMSCGNGKLRQWLIEQIDSNKYQGLVWENEEKTIFRIPWKHAGKQDYNREEDAALFKAWALFKGKFREGIDKPDPPTWKTRLRCALNKSNDFEELVERSQLDISDPYKVYRIVPEGAKKGVNKHSLEDTQMITNNPYTVNTTSYSALPSPVPSYRVPPDLNWREYMPDQSYPEISYQCTSASFAPRSHHWQGPACQNGCQVTGAFYACPPPESQTSGIPVEPSIRSGEAVAFSASWTSCDQMANAEVSIPVGDVVVVPTEGNEGGNPEDTKTQVILQLQPVQQGDFHNRIYPEGSESSTAVVAVETHTLHKLEEGIDPSTLETSEEIEIVYPITCGESKAILLWKKFVCPGINVKCVKFNDQLISPKHFVHLAGKSTLKDWKRAIRLGGIMLRKMMDSGQIDFYQHDKVCTNTCRSTKFDLLISSARAPVPGQQSLVQTPTSADGSIAQIALSEESMEEGIEWNSALTTAVTMATGEGIKKDPEEISEDTLMFWKGIADVGLMEEVVCNVQKEIEEVLKGVQKRLGQSPLPVTDAAVLNNVAHTFGLMDTVKRVLDNRKNQANQGEEQLLYTLADLERQLEEQKNLARDQKIKSQAIQNVVLMPVSAPKPPKRPRLQRPASATVLSSSAPIQQPQFTVFSPITIAPMGQPFSVSNIPMATISQGSSPVTVHTLPSGSQLFRYASVVSSSKTGSTDTVTLHPSSSLALLSSAAMQDSGQLANVATVVNPVELVAMESGLTSTLQEVEGTSEDGQTIIEIDPAPDPEAEKEESRAKAVILGAELRTEEKVVAEVDEHQHQVHNVEIVVLED